MTSSADTTVDRAQRELWVDNLRVLVVAGVIVAHTGTGYLTDIADWPYDERTSSELWSTVLVFPLVAGALFGLGPLFLLAGWFSARSLPHRGPGGFARSRLLRLGVPVLAYIVLVNPLANYVSDIADEEPRSFAYYVGIPELGVMWFVAALLVFSLVFAAVRELRPAKEPRPVTRLGALLTVAALTIAVTSFLVWQLWPWNSNALFVARLGEWPQGAVLFALGVHAGEHGWLTTMPRALVRRLGQVAAMGTVLTVALFAALEVQGRTEAVLYRAAGWPTLVFALLDGLVAVSLTLWFTLWVRRRWSGHGPLVGKAARASYATYLMHPVVLTAVMVAFSPVPAPPEIKFVVVSALGVVSCFVVGYALTRVPVVSKVV